MVLELITASEALDRTAKSLAVPCPNGDYRSLVAQALRRDVYAEAPCTRFHVERRDSAALSVMRPEFDWPDLVEECLDDLIQYGDIFEMRLEDQEGAQGAFRLWPAPPAYVRRRDRSIVLLGIAGEEITPAADWPSPITYRRGLRFLPPHPEVESVVAAIGLPQLSEQVWLRTPDPVGASTYLTDWRAKLDRQPYSGVIERLEILGGGPSGPRRRWAAPTAHDDGVFVGRRGQRYGNPRWCFVRLESGRATRLIDLGANGDTERPCDIAWRIKAALDCDAGMPQHVDWSLAGGIARGTFYHPLPSWAERRLAVIGDKETSESGLFTFNVPASDVEHESVFLAERLWTKATIVGG